MRTRKGISLSRVLSVHTHTQTHIRTHRSTWWYSVCSTYTHAHTLTYRGFASSPPVIAGRFVTGRVGAHFVNNIIYVYTIDKHKKRGVVSPETDDTYSHHVTCAAGTTGSVQHHAVVFRHILMDCRPGTRSDVSVSHGYSSCRAWPYESAVRRLTPGAHHVDVIQWIVDGARTDRGRSTYDHRSARTRNPSRHRRYSSIA